MYTLGIDLHKRSSAWSLIDASHTEVWKTSVVSHPDHFSKILTQLPATPPDTRVAIEPVAGWRWVTKLLEHRGFEVHIAHPRKVKVIAESSQKTDEADAYALARLLASGYFPEARRVSDDIYELRLLLRTRAHVVRMRTSVINRLHGIATTQGLHAIASGNPVTVRGRASIFESDSLPLQELHTLIDALTERIAVYDAECRHVATQLPHANLLMTMPGVGVITALTVLAEVGDFTDFSTPKKLVSYAGLAPRQRSSGGTVRLGSITHEGSPFLRTALVECAMRIHPKSAPELYAFVLRLTPHCGAKKARVALARKLLTYMWHMVVHTTPYDATQVSSSHITTVSDPDTGSGA